MERFNGIKALVIGDVMIDAYSIGVVERMSPEAPVPVVNVKRRSNRLGGAANVALNLKALGATPIVCSVVGEDAHAALLLQLMQEHGLDTRGIIQSSERITTVKHRVLNGDKQMIRIDEEDTHELSQAEYDGFYEAIRELTNRMEFDIIILQDYNKGVLSKTLIQSVLKMAHDKDIPVAVDPKRQNFLAYQGVTLFKPNAKELREGMGMKAETLDELKEAAMKLQEQLHCQNLMVTLSQQGAMILSQNDFYHVAACPRHIVDVSGAGDTVLSVAALCTALKMDPKTTVTLSNIAGGLVCEQVGVVPIDKERFAEEVQRLCHD